ncbi:MAG TPA: PA14 domain-containing protein, partial [Draconibacterium sp.]|nr:PA14 domain-containing protein [Draconibacterium sp.]
EDDDFEIYNVVKDPQEAHNLAADAGMDKLQKEFKEKALQSRMPNNTAARPYDDALIPAVKVDNIKNGIEWKAYDGPFPWVPEITTLTAVDKGVTEMPNVQVTDKKQNVALYFEGFIRAPSDGEYSFFVTANSGALLRIHNAAVVDADYEYFQKSPKKGKMKLKAGLHPFRLYFLHQKNGRPSLKLEWSGPGINRELVPSSVLFHAQKD